MSEADERTDRADPLERWSARDEAAQPGSIWNSERSPSSGERIATAPGWPYGALIEFVGMIKRERAGRETFVELHVDRVVVSNRGKVRTVRHQEIQRVEIARFPTKVGPVVSICLHDGQRIDLPDALYPDALGLFPSMRHQERARAIRASIEKMRAHPDGVATKAE